MDTDEQKSKDSDASIEIRRKRFIREMIGMIFGVALAYILGRLAPSLRDQLGGGGFILLWGAAIGGLLASVERFESAGAALTHSENRALNYLVGVGVPVVLLAILYWALIR